MRWLLLGALVACQAAPRHDVEAVLRGDDRFQWLLEGAAEHRMHVLLATVEDGRLVRSRFDAGPGYFYPASAIKTCAAVAALQWLEETPDVDLDTPLRYAPCFEGEAAEEGDPSNLAGGTITVRHELRKLFLVSDNRAYNRLYELVGHDELNRRMWDAGLASLRLHHRLSERRTHEENKRVPAISVDGVEVLPARTSALELPPTTLGGLAVGDRHVAGGETVDAPMDFARKNAVSLEDLQDLHVMLVRPDVDLGKPGLPLSDEHRAVLLEAMTQLPRESENPRYDHADDWVKFLLPGLRRVVGAEHLRVANKVGRAYGFSVENAYVEDMSTGRAFFLTAVLYTNPNRTVNDGVYAYADVADPYFVALGEAVARALWD